MNIPDPVFKNKLPKFLEENYEREYGVQYSEVAISLLAFATYHFPKTSLAQVVVPERGIILYFLSMTHLGKDW